MKQYFRNGMTGLRLKMIPVYVYMDVRKLAMVTMALLCAYFVVGDIYLYTDIQRNNGLLPIIPAPNETFPCYSSPFCAYSVKTLFLDYPNFYVFLPLAALIHDWLPFTTTLSFISPSMISFAHVLVAILAGRCVAHDSLNVRRAGVFIYQIRNFMDTLDGTMARSRSHRGLSTDQDRFIGYYVDGICDALGCIALVIGCYVYLHRHPSRSIRPYAYSHLPLFVTSRSDDTSEGENDLPPKASKGKNGSEMKVSGKVAIYFIIQSFVCSVLWNGYIEKFSNSLEKHGGSAETQLLQGAAARSAPFWIICQLWRLFNPQSIYQFLCTAIVVDRMGEFLSLTQYYGYVGILGTTFLTQLYYMHIHLYDKF